MKRPVLIEHDEIFAALDARTMTPAMKAKRPEGTLPEIQNRITSAAGGQKKKSATLYLYDEVSWWSANSARIFRQQLEQLDAEEIHLHINSPGGSVFEGVTIYNLLAAHPAEVIVHIDGLAASIASVIALCGDRIEIAENAQMMIHNPSVVAWGDAEVMRKQAEILDKIKTSILNTYESRTTMEREKLSTAMDEVTWYSADEAVAAGFATVKVAASKAAALWDPEDFEGFPEAALMLGKGPDPAPVDPPEPEIVGSIEDVTAASDLIARIKAAHGL